MSSVYAADDANPVTTQDWELLTFELAILARANVKLLAGAVFSMGKPTQSTSHLRDYFRLGVDIAY